MSAIRPVSREERRKNRDPPRPRWKIICLDALLEEEMTRELFVNASWPQIVDFHKRLSVIIIVKPPLIQSHRVNYA